MVLLEQLVALLDYVEGNRELALGLLAKTKEGRNLSKTSWSECAEILNSISPNCPKKSPEEWRSYFNELKYKTLKKFKARKSQQGPAGGKRKKYVLTPTQKRLYAILQQLQDVVDPFQRIAQKPLSQGVLPDCASPKNETSVPKSPSSPRPSPPPSPPPSPHRHVATHYSSADSDGSPEPIKPVESRKKRHSRRHEARDAEIAQLEAAQRRLERIEQLHAEAIMAQARATDRMAAAIERAVDRLSEPLVIVLGKPSSQKSECEGESSTVT